MSKARDLADLLSLGGNAGVGQILKYDGANWQPSTDLTADPGAGITLTDLSVSVLSPGDASLSYDNSTGVFSYTPPDLSNVSLEIGDLTYTEDTSNSLTYANGTYDFGSNLLKYANAIDQESDLNNYSPATYHGMVLHVHSTGGLYYAHAGAWRKLLTDVEHNDVEGAGYVNPLSEYAYASTNPIGNSDIDFGSNKILYGNVYSQLGDLPSASTYHGMFAHVHGTGKAYYAHAGAWVELANASEIGSGSGASSLDDLSDVSTASVTSGQILKYDGTNWVPATDATADSGSGIALTDLSVSVLSPGSANLVYDDSTGVFSYTPPNVPATLLDLNITDGSSGQVLSTDGTGNFSFISVSGTGGLSNVVDDTSPQLGGDLDVNSNSILHTLDVTNNGSSDYTFSDAGNHWFPSPENDPVLYLRRGETYVFDVNASGHPFEIRVSNGGSAFNTGVSNNGAQVGQVEFKVPMSAPSTLYYQCTVHSSMGNTINVV